MERSLGPGPSGQKPREKRESHEEDLESTRSRLTLSKGENAWAAGVGREPKKRKLSLGQIGVANRGVGVRRLLRCRHHGDSLR